MGINNVGKTSYETDPAQNLNEALIQFVTAYDNLQALIYNSHSFSDELKMAMYRPICLDDQCRMFISLYEIGVVYFPQKGKYGVDKKKLEDAFLSRPDDLTKLFIGDNGLLPRLCEIVPAFLESDVDLQEDIYTLAMRFLNECRRLMVMF